MISNKFQRANKKYESNVTYYYLDYSAIALFSKFPPRLKLLD